MSSNQNAITTMRLHAGLKQVELAALMGVRPQVLWNLEHGKKRPSKNTLKRIADALGLTERDRDALYSHYGFIPPRLNPLTETSLEKLLDLCDQAGDL